MNKRTIIILIICAALIAAVGIISLRKDPGITGLYLNGSPAEFAGNQRADGKDNQEFNSDGSDIYLIITIRDLDTEDRIEVVWSLSTHEGDSIFQENTVQPANPGSGEIIIYLLKRDDSYPEGDYAIEVVLNNSQTVSAEFTVTDQ